MSFLYTSDDQSDSFSDRCFNWFPCLADPAKRSTLCVQVMLLILHLVYVAFLFIFDKEFIEKLKEHPWYTLSYLLLFVVTLVQYSFTSGSDPGYVLDAMREFARADASLRTSEISQQPASNGSDITVPLLENQRGENILGNNRMNWTRIVMDLYPDGTPVRSCTCSYCNVVQPPRAKHCHDCDRCVLQFDHHCVWLGTCIGQGNHCRFWWYVSMELALGIWTGIWYFEYLNNHFKDFWLSDTVMIIMLSLLFPLVGFLLLLFSFHSYLILTNQTTYEMVRRRRISYMRSIPERVLPFNKGVCKNLFTFCCARTSKYKMEALPSAREIDQLSITYVS